MAPLEPWEKVLISGSGGSRFLSSVHGQLGCRTCHGGKYGDDLTKEEAHSGLTADPSANPEQNCGGSCHGSIVSTISTSIHTTLRGMVTAIEARTGCPIENTPGLKEGFESTCMRCHTTCGECHISRPNSVGGGFVSSHEFKKEPHISLQCTACHGSRVGAEYRGENVNCKGDLHYLSHGMMCQDCHTADELHGGGEASHRYEVNDMPRCEDCHGGVFDTNEYHRMHWGTLSCQGCHSQSYKNCNACHAHEHAITGSSYMRFEIGRNPLPELREYKYVTLRHIPIADDTYAGWGVPSLGDYSSLPTWKYCSPHNIRLRTDRTPEYEALSTCNTACHQTDPSIIDGYFFRQVDLDSLPDVEVPANAHLIVPDTNPGDGGWN